MLYYNQQKERNRTDEKGSGPWKRKEWIPLDTEMMHYVPFSEAAVEAPAEEKR